jgi:hypothetical protein
LPVQVDTARSATDPNISRDPQIQTDPHPEHPPLPRLAKVRLGVLVLDRAEPVEAAEVVHAVHAEDPTAIVLCLCELFGRTVGDYC